MPNEIIFNLKGYFRRDEVAEGFVSYCPTLNVYSHGKTAQDAIAHLEQTVTLYLETCLERETLDKVMRAAGFDPSAVTAGVSVDDMKAEFVAVLEQKFDRAFDMAVPFPLLAQSRNMPTQHT
jgi:predicted RNase H-like HicB family nuclease